MKLKGIFWIGLVLFACGCTNVSDISKEPVEVAVESEETLKGVNIYDSEDTAIFLYCDEENKLAHFQNASTGKRYTLGYTTATSVLDKYGQHISMSQIKTGTMSLVRFYKETKNLTYIIEATDCTSFTGVENYELDYDNATISIYGGLYKFNKNLTVMSQNEEITISDIEDVDKLSVWGYNEQIYSISVDKGHGFLTFSNDSYFIDGWVEVGEKVIKPISEGMKLVVPEGTYTVSISASSTKTNKKMTFKRGETLNWDLSEVEIQTPKTGNVIFTITPATARVYIDGEEVDTSYPVEEEYGIHQITVIASGYETISKYMKVGTELANISIDLEKQEETSDESDDTETETKESETTSEENKPLEETNNENNTEGLSEASSSYKVYIDKPEGAEVYVDGNYIGIAPTSFAKQAGSIVVTLRQSGYQTRSYSLEIDDEEKDTTYSFSDLEKNE